MLEKYPSLLRRYFAAVLDFCFILFIIWVINKFFIITGYKNEDIVNWIYLLPIILYEPILSSQFATFGQLVFSFRIRKLSETEKPNLLQTFPRTIAKYFLGVISFFTMAARHDRRSMHDLLTKTIVVNAKYKIT